MGCVALVVTPDSPVAQNGLKFWMGGWTTDLDPNHLFTNSTYS